MIASKDSKTFDDPGEFQEIGLANRIRERVDSWKEKGYPNITGITRQLLKFWYDGTKRANPFFFCQLEAIETLIWLIESHESEKQGIGIPTDGGPFQRLCSKMATGSGKTIVMAMLVAWQVLNKATYSQDVRFSKNVLIMAPGLTIKSRLEVLIPDAENNYYDLFGIVPSDFYDRLRQARVVIHNWHTLVPLEDAKRGVVKKGQESDAAFSKRILGFDSKSIIVINDEAHHAWRKATETDATKDEEEEATRWMEGLDKIHRSRGILKCFDFSATPFIPTGKDVSEEMLFEWVVSDFSLNDAIESGLVKTPKIAIRDDSGAYDKNYQSKFYHIYMDKEVKANLNRRAKPEDKLPDLVKNAYYLLGQGWTETQRKWNKSGSKIPPVMITVCNRTETAARIKHSFEKNKFGLDVLSNPEFLLHIDSKVLKKAEKKSTVAKNSSVGQTSVEDDLRGKVNTIGQEGKPGEKIRNIIAVQMLSEGWDAKTVTHIMGLRAFSSQLLCEQVVGRGLRRRSYEINKNTRMFDPEYVYIFGVPFTFLPHESTGSVLPPPKPTTKIEPDAAKIKHEITWPNVDRIETVLTPRVTVDWSKISALNISSTEIATTVGMSPIIGGKPHVDKMSDIEILDINNNLRMQKIIFIAAKDVYDMVAPNWRGDRGFLLAQVIVLIEDFIKSGKLDVVDVPEEMEVRRRMTIIFNMQKIVSHVFSAIKSDNLNERKLIFNAKPRKSTADMQSWYTKKPCICVKKSHINMGVFDLGWEVFTGQELESKSDVVSWAKNDHLGFVIKYIYSGSIHDYWPDFLVRLKNGINLVLEIKGRDTDRDVEKRRALAEWVAAVNENDEFGTWASDVAFSKSDVRVIIAKHSKSPASVIASPSSAT